MKTLKKILIVLGIIIAIPLVVALFMKKEYIVERSTEINRPTGDVFNYVKHLKNHDNFTVWSKMDPDMVKEFRGEDATVGFVSAWDSQKEDVGKGEQEISKITEGQSIETELRFIKPFESKAQSAMITEPAGPNQTKVRWNFQGKMPYPMNFMLLFMNMDDMLGKDLQQGLDNLKKNLETTDEEAQG
jgi:hypothetical protein